MARSRSVESALPPMSLREALEFARAIAGAPPGNMNRHIHAMCQTFAAAEWTQHELTKDVLTFQASSNGRKPGR